MSMAGAKDGGTDRRPGAAPAAAEDAAKRTGRATFDPRGNSVWEWQTSPGVFERVDDATKIRDLSAAELKLMETQALRRTAARATAPTDKAREAAARRKREGGFNPYELAATAPPEPPSARDPAPDPPAVKNPRRGLLARLRLALMRGVTRTPGP
jgi:hypothetical protein